MWFVGGEDVAQHIVDFGGVFGSVDMHCLLVEMMCMMSYLVSRRARWGGKGCARLVGQPQADMQGYVKRA